LKIAGKSIARGSIDGSGVLASLHPNSSLQKLIKLNKDLSGELQKMKAQEFVDTIRERVLDSSVSSMMRAFIDPPGRHPHPELVDVSKWVRGLNDDSRRRLQVALQMVAYQAVFGVLAVLDGARQVESRLGPKGHFELKYVKNGQEDVISGPDGMILHELL
jgi:hypothetical protein